LSNFVEIKLLKFGDFNGILAKNMIKYDKYKLIEGDKLKVKFFDKNLIKKYINMLSIINLFFTSVLIFWDIPQEYKLISFIVFIAINVSIYIFLFVRANKIINVKLDIDGSIVEIKEGNIFKEEDLKVINFNEYFDTKVDNKIIAENTLNGQFIKKYVENIEELDNLIDQKLEKLDYNTNRKDGKKKRYALGEIVEYKDFLITSLSKFDDQNRANLTLKEYIGFLMNFWNSLDVIYANRNVSITIFGSGITRFKEITYISDQELLEIIIWSFKISKVKFKYPTKISIIIPKEKINKINLYKIKGEF
jgi:hypothetical protein